MWHSDYEIWKFISFVKELTYENVIFDSDAKVKKSDVLRDTPFSDNVSCGIHF